MPYEGCWTVSFFFFPQVGRDPEANRYKRVKEEEERLRADLRRNSKMNRVREKATSRGLSKGYLEGGDSDEEGFSISAIKNKYKKGGAAARQGNYLYMHCSTRIFLRTLSDFY